METLPADNMRTGAQMRELGNRCSCADPDGSKAVDDDAIAQRGLVSDLEGPGNGDLYGWKDMNGSPDPGAESPQNYAAPALSWRGVQGESGPRRASHSARPQVH